MASGIKKTYNGVNDLHHKEKEENEDGIKTYVKKHNLTMGEIIEELFKVSSKFRKKPLGLDGSTVEF